MAYFLVKIDASSFAVYGYFIFYNTVRKIVHNNSVRSQCFWCICRIFGVGLKTSFVMEET